LSVALAHASLYVVCRSTFTVPVPSSVRTGFVVSTTLIVLISWVAVLFWLSVTLYLIVYTPTTPVFTLPDVMIELVRLPSSTSDAVAHASVYVVQTSIVRGVDHESVRIGVPHGITCTVLVTCIAAAH
jgi:hypothetical protein